MAASEKAIVQSSVDKLICVKCKGEIGIQKAQRTIHAQTDDKVNNSILDLQRDLIELDQLGRSAVRRSVKEIIIMEMDTILAKINSLKELKLVNKGGEGKWTEVVSRGKKSPQIKQANIFQLPEINNRYGILTSKSGCDEKNEKKVNSVTKREEGRNTITECKKKKHRIILLGDSHARGIAKELQYQLGYDFEVQGIVKPGVSAESIVKSTVNLSKWTQDDFCIIWGGTHDVSKNETNKGLCSLKDFMNKHNQTNVIVMGVPQRYVLKEARVLIRKLKCSTENYKSI
jgi:hypothetical protein